MGSSHSYLQELQATPVGKIMHNIKNDICYQYPVATQYMHYATLEGAMEGHCVQHGYAVKDKEYYHLGMYGEHKY